VTANTSLASRRALGISLAAYLFAHFVIAAAGQTGSPHFLIERRYLRQAPQPLSLAWLAPLLLIYTFAQFFPAHQTAAEKVSLILVLWIAALTLNSLLNAANDFYEKSKAYNGSASRLPRHCQNFGGAGGGHPQRDADHG
jgi:hypothetical protein